MQLKTDFRDWYDFAFDNKGPVLDRHSTGGLSRPAIMRFLGTAGFQVPRFGLSKNLVPLLFADIGLEQPHPDIDPCDVVVHTDINLHCGEGKLLVPAGRALREYPDCFSVEYIRNDLRSGTSFRWLQVGEHSWWIRYWSAADWRSNVGDGGYEIVSHSLRRPSSPLLCAPLFAIDFAPGDGDLYAIDYNSSPGLAPLNGHITAAEIVDAIQPYVEVSSFAY